MNVDIIAELGINHNGSLDKAEDMILAAKQAGVKTVKFQHYDALKLLGADSPYLEYASKCQFTKQQHEELKQFCDVLEMEYLVSVFDVADIPWADSLCKRHKVASRMNKNQDFINALLATGKQVIMSIQPCQKVDIVPGLDLMVCITEYPTDAPKMHKALDSINWWKSMGVQVGLSSHCPDIKPTLVAITNGAKIVEHHVTFSRSDEGCDQGSSITFDELKQLNRFANEIEIIG